jgi:hypothetical protein
MYCPNFQIQWINPSTGALIYQEKILLKFERIRIGFSEFHDRYACPGKHRRDPHTDHAKAKGQKSEDSQGILDFAHFNQWQVLGDSPGRTYWGVS